jgi:DNA-binding FrmR family transcriptional regulator
MADLQIKGMLEEIVRGMVDEETVTDILRDEIRDRLASKYDYEIEKVARDIVRKKADSIIMDHVNKCLKDGVTVDNGWGHKETHISFEDYVRQQIKQEFDSKWEVQRTIKDAVEKKIKAVCKNVMDKNLQPCIDKAVQELAGVNSDEK